MQRNEQFMQRNEQFMQRNEKFMQRNESIDIIRLFIKNTNKKKALIYFKTENRFALIMVIFVLLSFTISLCSGFLVLLNFLIIIT
jgi:flagellar biosynthesis protein FliP